MKAMNIDTIISASAVVISCISIGISMIVSIITLVVSNRKNEAIAKKFGDVAGAIKTIEHEKKQADEARVFALQSLLNEVERIRSLAEHNSQLIPDAQSQPITKMPVSAFETAFVSGMPISVVSQELLDIVPDYLTRADSINTLVDVYIAGTPSGENVSKQRMRAAVTETKRICTDELPRILGQLSNALQRELETTKQKLH